MEVILSFLVAAQMLPTICVGLNKDGSLWGVYLPGSCMSTLAFLMDFSWQENTDSSFNKEKTVLSLANMGYTLEEASKAIDKCGEFNLIC